MNTSRIRSSVVRAPTADANVRSPFFQSASIVSLLVPAGISNSASRWRSGFSPSVVEKVGEPRPQIARDVPHHDGHGIRLRIDDAEEIFIRELRDRTGGECVVPFDLLKQVVQVVG